MSSFVGKIQIQYEAALDKPAIYFLFSIFFVKLLIYAGEFMFMQRIYVYAKKGFTFVFYTMLSFYCQLN